MILAFSVQDFRYLHIDDLVIDLDFVSWFCNNHGNFVHILLDRIASLRFAQVCNLSVSFHDNFCHEIVWMSLCNLSVIHLTVLLIVWIQRLMKFKHVSTALYG